MTKAKAYYQAYLVLDCLSKEEYSLIPKELLEEIKLKMEPDPDIKVDSSIALEKQKIDEKTYDILDRVIKAIERAYGSDAIDNPEKYATDTQKQEKKEKQQPIEEIDLGIEVEEKKPNIKAEKAPENAKDLKEENLKLHNIIKALEEENKKISEAKTLYYDYKEVVAKKDERIRALKQENDALKRNNEELIETIQKVPKLVRKIFIKDYQKMLGKGE